MIIHMNSLSVVVSSVHIVCRCRCALRFCPAVRYNIVSKPLDNVQQCNSHNAACSPCVCYPPPQQDTLTPHSPISFYSLLGICSSLNDLSLNREALFWSCGYSGDLPIHYFLCIYIHNTWKVVRGGGRCFVRVLRLFVLHFPQCIRNRWYSQQIVIKDVRIIIPIHKFNLYICINYINYIYCIFMYVVRTKCSEKNFFALTTVT